MIDGRVVGRCSQCGGTVVMPHSAMQVGRVLARCEGCGAVQDETAGLPVVKTRGGSERPREQYAAPDRYPGW